MKKLSTVVAGIMAMGLVAHAGDNGDEPRYKVFDVRMSGAAVGIQEDKGKEIVNGEVEKIDKAVKESGKIRGYLISDESEEWESFLTIEKGDYDQSDADMEAEGQYYYLKVVEEKGKPFSNTEKGLAQVYLRLYFDDVSFESIMIGNYSASEKEVWKSETTNTVFKFSFSGTGAGIGETDGIYPISGCKSLSEKESASDFDPRIMKGLYVKNSKMKYNKKISNLLSEAYAEEYAESEDEEAAVAAAEEALNAFINKKAKIDDAEFELYYND